MKHFPASELYEPTATGAFRRMVIDVPSMRAGLLGFASGEVVRIHGHMKSEELFLFVSGTAIVTVGDNDSFEVKAGDVVIVVPGEFHTFTETSGPLAVLAVVAPNIADTQYPV